MKLPLIHKIFFKRIYGFLLISNFLTLLKYLFLQCALEYLCRNVQLVSIMLSEGLDFYHFFPPICCVTEFLELRLFTMANCSDNS